MTFKLLLDYRERELKTILEDKKELKTYLEVCNLEIGDIIIKNDYYEIIIERKTLCDLVSSIKDGRYKEQKFRLQSYTSANKTSLFCYLIEGISLSNYFKKETNLLYGGIISSVLRDNIPLFRTIDIKESVLLILRLFSRFSKKPNEFFKYELKKDKIIEQNTTIYNNSVNENNNTINKNSNISENLNNTDIKTINLTNSSCSENSEKENNQNNQNNENNENENIHKINVNVNYLENIKINKKSNITPQNWSCLALSNIPGVSVKIANTIIQEFGSIKNLINKYSEIEEEKKEKLLSELKIIDGSRKIGNVLSKKIFEYLK